MKKTINLLLRIWLLSLFIPSSLFSQITNYYVKAGATGDGSSWDNPLGNLPSLNGVLNDVHIYIAEGDYTLSNPGTAYYNYTGGNVLIQGGFPQFATGVDLSRYNPEAYISRISKNYNGLFITINASSSNPNDFANNKLNIKGIYFKSNTTTPTTTTTVGNIINDDSGLTQYYQLKVEECQIHDSYAFDSFFRLDNVTTGKITHWFHNNKFYRNSMIRTGPFKYNNVIGDVKVLLSGNLIGEGSANYGTGFFAENSLLGSSVNSRFYMVGNVFSCGISNNSSSTGGVYLSGVENIIVRNNVFLGNKARYNGGAIQATAISGFQIEDNYFIQNGTYGAGSTPGYGGAIFIRDLGGKGNLVESNHIKGNFFYENNLDTSNGGGSAIYLEGATMYPFDIIGNVFAYNTAQRSSGSRQALIQTIDDNIKDITNNVFFGNANANGDQDVYAELKVNSESNVSGNIANNKFQLSNASGYVLNELTAKISSITNTFATNISDVRGVKRGDYTIDCYTGSVGCFKVNETNANVLSKVSKVGISIFKSQNSNWPQKDLSNNDINNGVMVLASKSKPMVITRVKNPTKVLGTDPELKGALAYDTEKKCLMLFDGEKWDCIALGCDKTIYDILEDIKISINIP